MTTATAATIVRPTFDEMNLSTGKRTRLHRLMYEHGPAERDAHDAPDRSRTRARSRRLFRQPRSIDTDWIYRLAVERQLFRHRTARRTGREVSKALRRPRPAVLKVNGKTNVPSDDDAFSPLTSSVEDAVRLGADAVGYTLYVGSPAQEMDIAQCNEVRRECERYGMPLVVWAYPRGAAIKAKGGIDSLYAVDYAARVACEMAPTSSSSTSRCGRPTTPRNFPNPTTRSRSTT